MADISVTFTSDSILSIGELGAGALFPGTFASDSIAPFNTNKIVGLPGSGVVPQQTFITDNIISIGGYNNTQEFGGLFRSDEVLRFYNKALGVSTPGNVIAVSFAGDEQLIFYNKPLSRSPLVVNLGGGPSTPRYFIG